MKSQLIWKNGQQVNKAPERVCHKIPLLKRWKKEGAPSFFFTLLKSSFHCQRGGRAKSRPPFGEKKARVFLKTRARVYRKGGRSWPEGETSPPLLTQ
jgi:hypothetical protein